MTPPIANADALTPDLERRLAEEVAQALFAVARVEDTLAALAGQDSDAQANAADPPWTLEDRLWLLSTSAAGALAALARCRVRVASLGDAP